MDNELKDLRVAFLVANEGIEEAELVEPWKAVEAAGGEPVLIAKEPGQVQMFRHLDKAGTRPVDRTTKEVQGGEFDGLVVPGGVANADQLRTDEGAVRFVRQIFESGKPAGVICHGPWILVEADVVRGRTVTSWPSLQTDLRNAGGMWVDKEVQVCHGGPNVLVTSRKPDDLPAFNAEITKAFAGAAMSRTR
jgi:protease I